MSVGNLKDSGNKGFNTPFQMGVLLQLKAIQVALNTLPGIDYETRTTTYQATAPGPGYGIGDIVAILEEGIY